MQDHAYNSPDRGRESSNNGKRSDLLRGVIRLWREMPPGRKLGIALVVDRTVQPKAGNLDLAFAVSEALEARLPWPIDVRVINDAPLPFSYNVSKGESLLLNEPEAYYTWLERTWDMWFDFKPIADQYLRDLA